MGKATKWIINFLLGKREDKGKKTAPLPSDKLETCILRTPIVLFPIDTRPNVRRRWSFERSTSTKPITHKANRSFDSIPTTTENLREYKTQLNKAMPRLLNLHVAATKIQAVYRSYLARRALHALRGLVKLQALARGHLVRKQVNSVLRSMHAVMAIQVRARIHRIQMAEQPAIMVKRTTSERHLRKQVNGVSRCRSAHIDPSLTERLCSNGGLPSDSEREYQRLRVSPSSLTLSSTDTSYATYGGHLEELSSKMERPIDHFRRHSADLENKHPLFFRQPQQCPNYMNSRFKFMAPNYMNITKSSKAKSRSHSVPRQRRELGTKQKSRRSSSIDSKNDSKNEYPWLN